MGVTIQQVLTDNGMSFRSGLFGETCLELGIGQRFTRAYRREDQRQDREFHTVPLRLSMSR